MYVSSPPAPWHCALHAGMDTDCYLDAADAERPVSQTILPVTCIATNFPQPPQARRAPGSPRTVRKRRRLRRSPDQVQLCLGTSYHSSLAFLLPG
jgi:hypothetical protein